MQPKRSVLFQGPQDGMYERGERRVRALTGVCFHATEAGIWAEVEGDECNV